MPTVNKCKSCIYKTKSQTNEDMCARAGWQIDLEQDGCTKHTYNAEKCDYCGRYIPNAADVIFNYGRVICPNCLSLLNHCGTCSLSRNTCNFSDQSFEPSIPPSITKQIQQGNFTAVTQVRNPERIEKACKNCSCWVGSQNVCGRQINQCSKYTEV